MTLGGQNVLQPQQQHNMLIYPHAVQQLQQPQQHHVRPLHQNNSVVIPSGTPNHHAPKHIKPKIAGYHHHQSVASSSSSSSSSSTKSSHPYATHQPQTVSVQRRNARERNRVKQVNNGFSTLRQHIPSDVVAALSNGGRGASKKLSKVDTLKVAVEYIRRLEDLLDEVVNDENASSSSGSGSASSSVSSVSSISSSANNSYASHHYAGNVSPTPSYASSSMNSASGSSASSSSIVDHPQSNPVYKYEVNEPPSSYDPDDEELLDCITWWQQQ